MYRVFALPTLKKTLDFAILIFSSFSLGHQLQLQMDGLSVADADLVVYLQPSKSMKVSQAILRELSSLRFKFVLLPSILLIIIFMLLETFFFFYFRIHQKLLIVFILLMI